MSDDMKPSATVITYTARGQSWFRWGWAFMGLAFVAMLLSTQFGLKASFLVGGLALLITAYTFNSSLLRGGNKLGVELTWWMIIFSFLSAIAMFLIFAKTA